MISVFRPLDYSYIIPKSAQNVKLKTSCISRQILLYFNHAHILFSNCGFDGAPRRGNRLHLAKATTPFRNYLRIHGRRSPRHCLDAHDAPLHGTRHHHHFRDVGWIPAYHGVGILHPATGKRNPQPHKNLSLDLTLLGLSIHSLADGFNLVIAEREAALGGMLVLAVLLHRLPIATVMAAALYKQHSEKPPENIFIRIIGRLTPLMVGPLVGALLGERLLQGTFKELTEYLTAFAAGTLLHVVMDEFRAREPRTSRITKVVFIVGFIFTFCAIYFFQEFDLGHHH